MCAASDSPPEAAFLPADRTRGVLQIATLLPVGLGLMVLCGRDLLGRSYHVAPLVNYSFALVMTGVGITGLCCLLLGLRWLVFALWPGRLGVHVAGESIDLFAGPFGRRRYDARRLRAVYRHECDIDDAVMSTEDFWDPDVERTRCLPLLLHPSEPKPLNHWFRRFITGSEAEQAERLRPLIDWWRTSSP